MKNRRTLPGCHVADALGEATADPTGPAGPLLLTAAAGAAVDTDPFNSRRLAAATVHANGANVGPSPLPPEPNQPKRFPLTPCTPPAAARAAARMEGAAAAAGDATGADEPSPAPTSESATGAIEFEPAAVSDAGIDGRSTVPGLIPAAPATPDTTELGRGCRTLEPAAAGPETPEESLPPVAGDSLPEPEATPLRRPDPAAAPPGARTGPRTVGDLVAGADDEAVDESVEPAEPADPVVSANATGTDATAEPTPNATANAPTRPT